jgi:purine-binding chemotaxis protein CheW
MESVNSLGREDAFDHDSSGTQYLTFALAEEEYGVEILSVQEVKGWTPVTRMPRSPDYVKGVLNLRGAIVPIIDLRIRFGIESIPYTSTTVVIVVNVAVTDGSRPIGIVVDAVRDVLTIPPEDIRPAPDFGATIDDDYITGLAKVDEKMVLVLDTDRLLSVEELRGLAAAGETVLGPES